MADPGAPSGAVAEVTTTSGLGPYQLQPAPPNALAAYFRFADVYADGAKITVEVDNTAKKEIITGIFDLAANTISRPPAGLLFSSDGPGVLINWPATGQRTIRPLISAGIPICATPPTIGQVLEWDGTEWCPATLTDDDTCDMQDFDTGTSFSITLTKPVTQAVCRSTTPGTKSWTIPGSSAGNNGFSLDIKTATNDGSTHTVVPTSGTIGGLPGITFTDTNCNLFLRSKFQDTDWIIRCLCCYTPTPFSPPPPDCPIGAHFDGSATSFLSLTQSINPPAWPADGTLFTMSLWIRPDSLPPNINGWVLTGEGGGAVSLLLQQDGSLKFLLSDAFSAFIQFVTTDHFIIPGTLYNILISADTNAGTVQCYINDALVGLSVSSAGVPFNIGYNTFVSPWVFYGETVTRRYIGDTAETWCAPNQGIDFSITGNRRKFIDVFGCFVNLGTDGSIPTGIAPVFFFTGAAAPAAGEVAYNVNKGALGGISGTTSNMINPTPEFICPHAFLCP
jgi:hypothetical protein